MCHPLYEEVLLMSFQDKRTQPTIQKKTCLFEDSDDNSFNCPICGEDLSELDSMWRQIHINSCLSKQGKPSERPCQVETCPVCGENLARLSASLARVHVNRCLDKQTKLKAKNRKTERCPFCGMNIKNLNARQRKIHEQTCQETNKAQTADVIQYPKIVESLLTPEEFQIVEKRGPVFVTPKPPEKKAEEVPLFGKYYLTSDLQCLEKHYYNQKEEITQFDFIVQEKKSNRREREGININY